MTLVVCIWTLVAGARPAAAHGLGSEAQPTNYRTTITGLAPAVAGVSARVLEVGDKLELTNRSGQEVLVLGYRSEPFLRVGPSGVFVNQTAPTVAANQAGSEPDATVPAGDPAATPDWRRISSRPVAVWHDHRSHWHGAQDPAVVRQAPAVSHVVTPAWQIPLRVGISRTVLSGSVTWVPGPPVWPWLVLAVALCAGVVIAGRTAVWRQALIAAIAVAVAADVLHTIGAWLGAAGPVLARLAGSGIPAATWFMGGVAISKLARGDLEAARPYMLIAGVLMAAVGGLADLTALGSSQIAAGLHPAVIRAAVSITLGVGAGMVATSQWRRGERTTSRHPGRRRPARRFTG